MHRARWTVAVGFICAILGGVGSSKSAIVTSLYNTGVDAYGVALGDALVDPHYTVTSAPPGASDALAIRTPTWPIEPTGPYFLGSNSSAWITPDNGTDNQGHYTDPQGRYEFTTSFSLDGYDPLTASISGGWSTDNDGIDILLNGVSIFPSPTSFTQFTSGFALFAINSGFHSGTNFLTFVVNNGSGSGGNPVALRVEMVGSADSTSGPSSGVVPEPASFGVWCLLGLCVAGSCRRRMKCQRGI